MKVAMVGSNGVVADAIIVAVLLLVSIGVAGGGLGCGEHAPPSRQLSQGEGNATAGAAAKDAMSGGAVSAPVIKQDGNALPGKVQLALLRVALLNYIVNHDMMYPLSLAKLIQYAGDKGLDLGGPWDKANGELHYVIEEYMAWYDVALVHPRFENINWKEARDLVWFFAERDGQVVFVTQEDTMPRRCSKSEFDALRTRTVALLRKAGGKG